MSRPGVVAIVGQGYVGLPLAMAATKSGWSVIGIDVSSRNVANLNSGKSHVEDVADLELQRAIDEGRYRASEDGEESSDADICVICVPTPLDDNHKPDLS